MDGLRLAKKRTSGSFCDHSVLLFGYGALHVADCLIPPRHRSFRFELRPPHGSKKLRISRVLMTGLLQPSPSAHELWFRGIPPDDGRQGHEVLPSSVNGPTYGCLRACWQST